MEPMVPPAGQMPETGGSGRAWGKGLLARLLPILGALLLSGGMLAAWFTGMARASSLIQEPPPAAPAASQFDIFKSNEPAKFTIGPGSATNNRYIIGVRINALPYPALLTVRDTMPAGVTISDVQAIDWNCAIFSNGSQISCNYTGQPASFPIIGQSYPPIIINLNIASSVAYTVTNKADLVIDGSYFSSSSPPLDTTIDSVDLSIKKSVSSQYVDINKPVTYTLIIHNYGPAPARDVEIIDKLPLNVAFGKIKTVPTDSASFKRNPIPTSTYITGTWNITPTMASGDEIKLYLPITPTVGAKLTNIATITSSNASDWNTSNNTSSSTFYVSGLDITKNLSSSSRNLFVGEPFTYTIIINNTSTENQAKGVSVTDVFSDGLSIIGYKIGNTFTPFSASSNSFYHSIGNLDKNKEYKIDLIVRGNSTITQPITVTNQATVRASPSIVRSSNITNTGVVTITPAVDLYVTTSDGVTEVTPNQVVTYTVTVQNIGSVTEKKKFVITDTLAENLDFVRFDLGTLKNELKAISPDDLTHVWSFDEELGPNEAISYRITGRVKSNAPVDNSTLHRVVVKSPDDKYDGDDTAEDRNKIVVHPTANFNFNLTSDRKRVEVGEGIHFLITLENKGDTLAPNARVTDVFPAVLDIVDAKTNFGTLNINASTRTVTVDLGYLVQGRKILIAISTKVNSSATTSAVYDHKSVLTYNPNVTIESNTVKFSVIAGGGILPGTGLGPPEHYADARASSPALWLLPFALLLPLVLLGGRWSRIRPT